jgi:hypothetical protein
MTAKRKPRTPNEKSVVALELFLGKIIGNPRAYMGDTHLLSALKRQGRLAKYSNVEHRITGTSRSTVERLAAAVLDGGFEGLNSLRETALAAVEEEIRISLKSKHRTKARLSEDLTTANFAHVQAMVDLWHVTTAFHEAVEAGRRLANRSRSAAMVELWDKEEERLLAMFDLAKRPVVEIGSATESWLVQLRQL